MKTPFLTVTGTVICVLPLPAQQLSLDFDYGSAPVVVPDGDLVGISRTEWINDPALDGLRVSEVKVTLTFSGGWNGDLYAQLNHNGQFSVLLNRPGLSPTDPFGYGHAGFSVTFADAAANGDVHWYEATLAGGGFSLGGGVLAGTWAPDGRPHALAEATDPSARTAMLSGFNDMTINGNWTLFVADLSPVGQGELLGWGLEFRYVPEPASCLTATALLLAGWGLWRRAKERPEAPSGDQALPGEP